MGLFRSNTIEKRVMGVVRDIIADAQTDLDLDIMDAEKQLLADIEKIEAAHESNKTALVEKRVQDVFKKLAGKS